MVSTLRIATAFSFSALSKLGGFSLSRGGGRPIHPSGPAAVVSRTLQVSSSSTTLTASTTTTRLTSIQSATMVTAGDSSDGVGQSDIGRATEASACSSSSSSSSPSSNTQSPGAADDSDPAEGKSFRQLLEASSAKSRKIRGSNYVQLATVDPATNEPRCRCVVFRGFLKLPVDNPCFSECDDLSCVMRMITDQRSQKVQQIMSQPQSNNRDNVKASANAELLWWFPKTSEQYRIRGNLLFVGAGAYKYDNDKTLQTARKEQWGNLSDSARESFFAPQTPGQVFVASEQEAAAKDIPAAGRDSEGKLLPPPDNFLLMLLLPVHCDYLRLTNMYRQIDALSNKNASDHKQWTSQRVNP